MKLKFNRPKKILIEHKNLEKKIFKKLESTKMPIFKPKIVSKDVLNLFWKNYFEKTINSKSFYGKRDYFKISSTVLGTVREHTKTYINHLAELYKLHEKIKTKHYTLAPVEIIDIISHPKEPHFYYILERVIPSIDGDTWYNTTKSQAGLITKMIKKGIDSRKLSKKISLAIDELYKKLKENNLNNKFDFNSGNILISDYDKKTNKVIIHFIDID